MNAKKATVSPFRRALQAALEGVAVELRKRVSSEHLYAFALYTSGERDYDYVCVSANTEEALTRTAARYAAKKPKYLGQAGRDKLRWSAGDWEHHDFSEAVSGLKLPKGKGEARDFALYDDLVAALRGVDEGGQLGKGKRRPTFAILCGDMSEAFLERGLGALNPPAVLAAHRSLYSPDSFLAELEALPLDERRTELLGLLCELTLKLGTDRAARAQRRNVTRLALEPLFVKLGASVIEPLLDLVEAHGFGAAFYEKGSEARKEHGAFTLTHRLALSALGLVGDVGPSEAQQQRLQEILRRRVELDLKEIGNVSLVATGVAAILHAAASERFPEAKKSPSTNRLENAEAFLAKAH